MKRVRITILTIAFIAMATICTVKGQTVMIMKTDQKSVNFKLSGSGKATIDWGEGKPRTRTVGKNTKFRYKYKANATHTITITGNHITELECRNNALTSLDVSKNTTLTELVCSYNQLTSLDVSKNTALTKLWCRNNQLTILDTSENPNLCYLDCAFNQLSSLNISNSPALKSLWCRNNQLSDSALNELLKSLPINEQGIELAPDYTIKNIDSVPQYCIDNNPGTASCDMRIMDNKGWLRNTVR